VPSQTFQNDLSNIITQVSQKIALLEAERAKIQTAVNASVDLPTNNAALVKATNSLASAQAALASLQASDCCTGQSCTITWTE